MTEHWQQVYRLQPFPPLSPDPALALPVAITTTLTATRAELTRP